MKICVHKEISDLDCFEFDILWREEAMKQRERIRRTNEADGYYQQEEEENVN